MRIGAFFKILFSPSRLRKKFLRFFFIVGLIPLILMGLIGLYIVNQTHRIDVAALEKQLADFKTTEIKKFIGDIVGLFQLRVGYEEYAEIELSHQQAIADKMLDENPAINEVSFINVYGRETVKSLKDKTKEKILEDRNASPEYLTAINGKDYFGPIAYAPEGPIITIASPVYNQKNQIIAVLAGKINLSPIQDEIISGTKLGNTGYIYLIDRDGIILAHSKKFDLGKNLIQETIISDILTGEERTALHPKAIYESFWTERVIGSGILIPELGWAVIVEWPFDDAQKVVGLMIAQLAQFSLITLILIFVLASLAALGLIKPISILKEGAGIIGAGNFDYRIKLRTGDEIEELGYSLNKMAMSLKELEELKEIKLRVQYLAESLKKERELSQLKNQFITVASHQLNTPLSVINWSLEAMQEPKISKKTIQEGIATIDQSRRDILAMVNDLLTLSEIGFRYQKTKSETADFRDLTNRIIERYRAQIDLKKLNIKFEGEIENVKADVDVWAIEKTIENLFDNAVSYSHDKGIIEIEFGGDNKQLTFKIKDYGIGIPKSDQPSIFKEFFRAKNVTAKKNVGTGLGLFIAKNFIEGHGGKIWFESEENKGSTFFFTIPRTT
jgi:signal transduction histidine kinase